MVKTMNYVCLKEGEDREKLFKWWSSLEHNRPARARLRRAERPEDIMLTEPFYQFLQQMPPEWSKLENLPTAALVAAALAHVKEHRGGNFAALLASPKEGGEKPRMSELRFQQLQKSSDPAEFFRRLLRAIRLVENKVNIYSLADSVWHWMNEYRFGVDREPRKRLAVRWANDYYTSVSKTKSGI